MSNVWLWIPVTVWAAFAQSIRNAAQRHLTAELGTIGATSVRFIYGLPFALVWLAVVATCVDAPIPNLRFDFWLWTSIAALAQIAGTALMLRTMAERNFALGVAYSRTEAIQIVIVSALFFGERLSPGTIAAVVIATVGVIVFSAADAKRPLQILVSGFTTRSALLGFGAGAGFGLSAVGFRNAIVTLPTHYLLAAATTLVVAQALQAVLLLGWMRWRGKGVIVRIASAWRGSLVAGFMGAAASAGWFTAMAIVSAAQVKTLGLSELFFSLVISRRVFKEQLRAAERLGMSLLALGLALVAWPA